MAAKPHKPAAGEKKPTPDQHRARTEIAILSAAWNNLTDEQREGWAQFAQSDRRGGLAARRRRRTGRTAFFRVNSRRFAAWQDLLDFPPWAAGCCSCSAPASIRIGSTRSAISAWRPKTSFR